MVPKWLDYACQIYGAALAAVTLFSLSVFFAASLFSYELRRFTLAVDYATLLAFASSWLCALVGCVLCGTCLVTNAKAPPRLVLLTVFAVIFAILVVLLMPAQMS
jgi:hypothetical protein